MIGKFVTGVMALMMGLTSMAGISPDVTATGPFQTEPPQGETAWIGALMVNVGPQVKERLQLDVDSGVVVAHVFQDGPAQQAGLAVKDLVIAVGGQTVTTAQEARQAIAQATIGQPIAITVVRGGQEQALSVTPTEAPGKLKVVQNVARRLGERRVARRNARRDQLLPGWRDIPAEERFDHTLGATFRYKDQAGNIVNVQTIPGVVVAASATSITITPNDPALSGGPFAITTDTAGAKDAQPGDPVRVVTADGQTALAVVPAAAPAGQ